MPEQVGWRTTKSTEDCRGYAETYAEEAGRWEYPTGVNDLTGFPTSYSNICCPPLCTNKCTIFLIYSDLWYWLIRCTHSQSQSVAQTSLSQFSTRAASSWNAVWGRGIELVMMFDYSPYTWLGILKSRLEGRGPHEDCPRSELAADFVFPRISWWLWEGKGDQHVE